MADNITRTGGEVVATDDIAGVHHQRVKVGFGVANSFADVSSTAPLPVQQRRSGTDAVNATHTTSGTTNTASEVVNADATRLEITITNISDVVVYLVLAAAGGAQETGIYLAPGGGTFYTDKYTGAIRSICTGTSKKLTVCEVVE